MQTSRPLDFQLCYLICFAEAALPALQRVVKEVGFPGMWRYNGIMVLSKAPQLAIKVMFIFGVDRFLKPMDIKVPNAEIIFLISVCNVW